MLSLMFLRRGLQCATITIDGMAARAVVDLFQLVDVRDQRRFDGGQLWSKDMSFILETPASALLEMDDGTVANVKITSVEQGEESDETWVKAQFIDAKQLREP
jgi:hypothetical protein